MRQHRILLLLLSICLLPGLQPGGGYLCEAGGTRSGMPDSLVPGTVSYYPNQRIFGNRLVGVDFVGAPLRVFRSTLQGFGINRLSASHRYLRLLNQLAMISPNDGTMRNLLCQLIVLYNS
jgi:hypothetical protein